MKDTALMPLGLLKSTQGELIVKLVDFQSEKSDLVT